MLTTDFHTRCENLAIHYRHKLGLQGYDSLSAGQLAELLGIPIYRPSDLIDGKMLEKAIGSEAWFALMVVDNETANNLIIYNPSHSEIDREESMTHELAHYILGHKPENLGAISARFVSRFYPKLKEEEANLLTDYLKFPNLAKDYSEQMNMRYEEVIAKYGISYQLFRRRT